MADSKIDELIYKELSRIMSQDMQCECKVYQVQLAPEQRSFLLGTPVSDRAVPWMSFSIGGVIRRECGNYATKTYMLYTELYEKYKNGDVMKVLFLAKQNLARFDAWYAYMDIVKKHRKMIISCTSPLDFCHKFDADKMGATYTAFYFDKAMGPADIYEALGELKHHYSAEDFKYIVENKLRTISIDDMIETNDMSKFSDLKVGADVLVDLGIKEKSMTLVEPQPQITIEMYLNLQRQLDELRFKVKKLEESKNVMWH